LILHNATFVCRDDADTLIVEGDRIAAVGRNEAIPERFRSDRERVDLGGRTILPGFVDAHVHLFNTGLTELGWRVALSGASRGETLERLSAATAERGSGEWVIGSGWDESGWDDRTYLSRRELDRISASSPIGAVRMDGHLIVVNSEALRVLRDRPPAGIDLALIDTERGEVREESAWRLLESIEPDRATLSDALAAGARLCHRCGITSVHAMTPGTRIPVFVRARGRDRLRVNVYHKVACAGEIDAIDGATGFDGVWLRFGGIKAFADGSLGAGNAALSEPYERGGTGALNHSDDELTEIVRRSERAGWQTAIHAIGDRAIEQVLRAHEDAGSSSERRHRIEHGELVSDEQIERARDAGLMLSMQPNFIGNWSGPGSMNERRLGRDRDERSNPLRHVLDGGAPLAFGSDGMPVSPLYGIHSAANGPYPAQRISVEEALSAYTAGGPRLSFEEDLKGRLEVGRYADLVVLDEDPRRDPEAVRERRIEAVYVGGELVYKAEEG